MDVLHQTYGYKSLHTSTGNGRKEFSRRFTSILKGSFFFSLLSDGRYRIVSEKKLLNTHAKGKNGTWFEIPDPKIMISKKLFVDFCVGSLLAGNKFRSNGNASKQLGCTTRRVQLATSRNHKNALFHKQFNHIEVQKGTYREVMLHRATLLKEHGITTPKPRKISAKGYMLNLSAPNSYKAIVSSGIKRKQARPTTANRKKALHWFKVEKIDCVTNEFHLCERPVRWSFDGKAYDFGKYVIDHSIQFDRDRI